MCVIWRCISGGLLTLLIWLTEDFLDFCIESRGLYFLSWDQLFQLQCAQRRNWPLTAHPFADCGIANPKFSSEFRLIAEMSDGFSKLGPRFGLLIVHDQS